MATGVTVERIMRELAGIAFLDLRGVVEWGQERQKPVARRRGRPSDKPADLSFVRLRNASDVPAHARRAIAKVKKSRDGAEVVAHDKLAALRLLGQQLGMFRDKSEGDKGTDALVQMIIKAHRRSQGEDANIIEGETV